MVFKELPGIKKKCRSNLSKILKKVITYLPAAAYHSFFLILTLFMVQLSCPLVDRIEAFHTKE